MAPIRLLAIAIGDLNTASARLRLYHLVERLPERFEPTVLGPGDADLDDRGPAGFDLIYVQKDARPATVRFCRRAVEAGVPVIYDIDDDFGCWPGMEEAKMCRLASVVTVDSAGRAGDVRRRAGGRVVVLPCMIDLADDPGRPSGPRPRERLAVAGSFGNLVSLRGTVRYLAAVPAGIETYVIGPADAVLPGTRLLPFRLDTFIADLAAADVFILAHGPREAPLKDNNRLVLALSLGVPALVSPTPAYLDTLAGLGLEQLACAPHEIGARLEELADPRVRRSIGDIGYEYAWAHYRPEVCAARFADVIDTVLEGVS